MRLKNKLNLTHIIHTTLFVSLSTVIHLLFFKNLDSHYNEAGQKQVYVLEMIIGLVLLLAILIWLIIRTNRRYSKPYSDIIKNLKNSKFIKVGDSGDTEEYVVIQRSIETLQNQLEFYAKNQKKSVEENAKLEKEIQIAKKLQRNILPRNTKELEKISNFQIAAFSEAAFDLGGDLYDFFILDDENLLFLIADVAGKGIPASLFMIFTQTLLRSTAKPGMSIPEMTNQLNDKLIEENISDLFVTMLLANFNFKTGELSYCNAGHNQPILIESDGKITELEDVHGIPLGLYPERNYKYSTVQLKENDQFFIYTDGLTDTTDENEITFSVDVLKYNLMGSWFMSPEEVVTKINGDVTQFRGNKKPVDDLTMLALKYTPGS